ncbi:MAG: hypothetical protein ACK5D5_03945 [Bacteroidota bacterium]
MQSDTAWKKLFTIKVKSDFFTTDNIGNIYVIHKDELIKYNGYGEILKRYSNKRLGNIFSVDASNPLRILVFYKDFSAVVILDSQLTENGESISLEGKGLEQCDLACTSFNNGVWLFNRQNMELIRLNEKFEIVLHTGNLNPVLGLELHPNFIIENKGYVYLNDPGTGVLVFDIYGTYYKTISLKDLTVFQITDQQILFSRNGKIGSYKIKEFKEETPEVQDTISKSFQTQKNNMYFQYSDSICVFSEN